MQAYLGLMAIRMGARLTFALDLPDDLRQIKVPPMLLQPLVENAVRHGVEPKVGGGSISICARPTTNGLEIEVIDDGQGLTDQAGGGTGLSNVHARLNALFGSRADLKLKSNTTGGTSATLTLPITEIPA